LEIQFWHLLFEAVAFIHIVISAKVWQRQKEKNTENENEQANKQRETLQRYNKEKLKRVF